MKQITVFLLFRYGFVTFESADEANKVREKVKTNIKSFVIFVCVLNLHFCNSNYLLQEDCLYLNGKKLNIGQAIRKQQVCFPKGESYYRNL